VGKSSYSKKGFGKLEQGPVVFLVSQTGDYSGDSLKDLVKSAISGCSNLIKHNPASLRFITSDTLYRHTASENDPALTLVEYTSHLSNGRSHYDESDPLWVEHTKGVRFRGESNVSNADITAQNWVRYLNVLEDRDQEAKAKAQAEGDKRWEQIKAIIITEYGDKLQFKEFIKQLDERRITWETYRQEDKKSGYPKLIAMHRLYDDMGVLWKSKEDEVFRQAVDKTVKKFMERRGLKSEKDRKQCRNFILEECAYTDSWLEFEHTLYVRETPDALLNALLHYDQIRDEEHRRADSQDLQDWWEHCRRVATRHPNQSFDQKPIGMRHYSRSYEPQKVATDEEVAAIEIMKQELHSSLDVCTDSKYTIDHMRIFLEKIKDPKLQLDAEYSLNHIRKRFKAGGIYPKAEVGEAVKDEDESVIGFMVHLLRTDHDLCRHVKCVRRLTYRQTGEPAILPKLVDKRKTAAKAQLKIYIEKNLAGLGKAEMSAEIYQKVLDLITAFQEKDFTELALLCHFNMTDEVRSYLAASVDPAEEIASDGCWEYNYLALYEAMNQCNPELVGLFLSILEKGNEHQYPSLSLMRHIVSLGQTIGFHRGSHEVTECFNALDDRLKLEYSGEEYITTTVFSQFVAACEMNQLSRVKYFFDRAVLMDPVERISNPLYINALLTGFLWACRKGHEGVVDIILEHCDTDELKMRLLGVYSGYPDYYACGFHAACSNGHHILAKKLLEACPMQHRAAMFMSTMAERDYYGARHDSWEAFVNAVQGKHTETVRFMIESVRDINEQSLQTFVGMFCAVGYDDEIRRWSTDAPSDSEDEGESAPVEYDLSALEQKAMADLGEEGLALNGFVYACRTGQVDVLELMLSVSERLHGRVLFQSYDNFTYRFAIPYGGFYQACANGQIAVVKLLLEKCPSYHLQNMITNFSDNPDEGQRQQMEIKGVEENEQLSYLRGVREAYIQGQVDIIKLIINTAPDRTPIIEFLQEQFAKEPSNQIEIVTSSQLKEYIDTCYDSSTDSNVGDAKSDSGNGGDDCQDDTDIFNKELPVESSESLKASYMKGDDKGPCKYFRDLCDEESDHTQAVKIFDQATLGQKVVMVGESVNLCETGVAKVFLLALYQKLKGEQQTKVRAMIPAYEVNKFLMCNLSSTCTAKPGDKAGVSYHSFSN
jgi:hypothetical protein